ncbi:Ugx2p KNAG_0C03730 [Huiozyma naganishii CBS 8797]|uniref:Uncharacterized protein n=1 Tax=Huiozyma naganishii (strain ATCC MYA-139 / BCRC 22969 / CBS 8797 / KCTC 17520 / NBRC 10181 / NCYC 3082 / Yp74L-3) TaxID=1071383 RepID=J7RWU8_HUIN7|nr:hypothetical protein KNAG_0C03730 [Kazachstania naganishii CBS 8797]CCK69477.1 hypothetical protein KNAG_0C03730 [Kazachstania naganishii CBS 8797]
MDQATSRSYLSETMLGSETPIVYSSLQECSHCDGGGNIRRGSFNGDGINDRQYMGTPPCHYCFCISTSQSQGFSWNQDLFASQYQQSFKVEYDGHEDSIDKLIDMSSNKFTQSHLYWGRRSRRTSDNCVSLVADSRNGVHHKTTWETIDLENEPDTPENIHLKWLINQTSS